MEEISSLCGEKAYLYPSPGTWSKKREAEAAADWPRGLTESSPKPGRHAGRLVFFSRSSAVAPILAAVPGIQGARVCVTTPTPQSSVLLGFGNLNNPVLIPTKLVLPEQWGAGTAVVPESDGLAWSPKSSPLLHSTIKVNQHPPSPKSNAPAKQRFGFDD